MERTLYLIEWVDQDGYSIKLGLALFFEDVKTIIQRHVGDRTLGEYQEVNVTDIQYLVGWFPVYEDHGDDSYYQVFQVPIKD